MAETARVTFNIDKRLLEELDSYADEMCITRTGAIHVLVKQAFEYKKAMDMLPQMMGSISDLKALEKSIKE